MNTITKINLFEGTSNEIAVFSSEFTRKIESMGLDVAKTIIKINADTPKGKREETEEAEAKTRSLLAHYCAAGYVLNGVTYVPFLAGASDARKATSTWIDQDVQAKLGKWALCGLSTKEMTMAVNKYMAYLGLLTSASKTFEEAFGKVIDIRRVAVIKDAYVKVLAKADVVTMSEVSNDQDRECEINAFDGFGIIRKELTRGESCTLRGPWLKAFAQAADFRKIAAFAYANGKNPEFVDFWGNTVSLKDVDIILTESCFKAAKLYKSWEQYQDAFEQMGHTICVCVMEHQPKLKGMPYQQGQTLDGNEEDALHFANHAHSTVYKYHDINNAAKLLSGYHRMAAKLYPALLTEGYTAKCIQEKYDSKRNDMLGGRIPEMGYNAFAAPDMKAFVEHLFGLEIVGSLKAGECYCQPAKPGKVDVTRSPHLDHAHVILNNVENMPFVGKTPTMFINIWDMTTIRLRCDYDGDHFWYSQDQWLLNLIEKTNNNLGNLPIDWTVESAKKSPINKATISKFICNLLHGSEIGIYADSLTKMWNSRYDRFVCNWLTYAGNVLIDAAKHASVKIKKPQQVQELSAIPLPEFARYAKADAETPADSKYWDEIREYTGTPRCAYSGSFLDMYSRKVKEIIPETLTIDGTDELLFDSTTLMIDPHRKVIPGLSRKGVWNNETKTYENAGIFQEIAFRHAEEWKTIMGDPSAKFNATEWETVRRNQALAEMAAYVRKFYEDAGVDMSTRSDEVILDAVYDTIVRNVFNRKMSEGLMTASMRTFWLCFGDRVVKTLESKFNKDVTDLGIDDDDDLFDVDCE